MSSSLSASWAVLSQEGGVKKDEFRVMDSGVAVVEGPALLAVDSRGFRHLLIPIRAGVHIEADVRSSGVHIVGRELIDAAGRASFVDVACRKPHLAEIFTLLAAEVLETLPTDPGRPATVARRVLNRWRELLERERPGVLSEAGLTGLFGELWILKRLAERSAGAAAVWAGPTGARFDFQRGRICLEVKTTTSLQRRLVHIHGIEQLDPPTASDLFLAVLTVERVKDAGLSVPELVLALRALGLDALELSSKLHAIGYSEHDEPHYSDRQLAVRSEVYFHVDASFPRLVRSSLVGGALPAGVGDVRYSIDLTSPPPTPIDTGAAARLLEQLAG